MPKKKHWRLAFYVYAVMVTSLMVFQLAVMYSPLVNGLAENLIVKPEEKKADAIVVLSSGAFADGTLGHFTLLRTLHGIRLYKEGMAGKIIFSGNTPGTPVSRRMAELASGLGVPEGAMVVEDKSRRTYEHALEVRGIMVCHGLKDALLVTSAIHMKRAMLTFERAGIRVYPAPANAFETAVTDPIDRLGMFRAVMREYAGLVLYMWKGWV
jgi:uncharacterized SAM-binding protein YcdF (DUF218 family)